MLSGLVSRQGWHSKMSSDTHCAFYYGLKPIIETEIYLRNHNIKLHLRNVLVKFRLGVTEIYCHRHKYSANDDLRKCPFCIRNYFEDENHLLFICPLYNNIRLKYFKDQQMYSHIDQCKFNALANDQYYVVSKYLFEALCYRKTVLETRMSK